MAEEDTFVPIVAFAVAVDPWNLSAIEVEVIILQGPPRS